ncbi:MAG: nicotinate-nucleotide adenylyltransferase [Proteobacteria bacterium]|jgi:nicotinate-nucleotide adenylyltransferase|nr:nicotinate-nucleotide adenylyltransferase [Pseudomonadota bacterium]
MTRSQIDIAIFGGTFDPVHTGHLAMAAAVSEWLDVDICFVPLNSAPHKGCLGATASERLAMLEIALADEPRCYVDDLEVMRGDVSYTIDTVTTLRAKLGSEARMYFVLGEDAYSGLTQWRLWQNILSQVHLVVCPRRPKVEVPPALLALEADFKVESVERLKAAPSGSIFFLDQQQIEVSSTEIRRKLLDDDDVSRLLKPEVLAFIKARKLYANAQ